MTLARWTALAVALGVIAGSLTLVALWSLSSWEFWDTLDRATVREGLHLPPIATIVLIALAALSWAGTRWAWGKREPKVD